MFHPFLVFAIVASHGATLTSASHGWEQCLRLAYPLTRAEFPELLNCLGLEGSAAEVGVQAGVHASSFLQVWRGRRLILVDSWSYVDEDTSDGIFYVDIANAHGAGSGKQHRTSCEKRLAEELRVGRAEIMNLDSAAAAAHVPDGSLDFVYLDARHDFAGVVADIHAWWPKVKVGGLFAGHDFVDGEFPEGDFFWISALHAVLPDLERHTNVTLEQNRYPSFFVRKYGDVASAVPRIIETDRIAHQFYAERSRYFALWRQQQGEAASSEAVSSGFGISCRDLCGQDCKVRVQTFTPTRTVGSTLRPFACATAGPAVEAPVTCAAEMLVDVQAYLDVCHERCSVTCQQRERLFSLHSGKLLSV